MDWHIHVQLCLCSRALLHHSRPLGSGIHSDCWTRFKPSLQSPQFYEEPYSEPGRPELPIRGHLFEVSTGESPDICHSDRLASQGLPLQVSTWVVRREAPKWQRDSTERGVWAAAPSGGHMESGCHRQACVLACPLSGPR